jgi:hypothetical protein
MGNAFITGQTASKNFPVAGTFTSAESHQTNLTGKIDAVVAAFDATGVTNFFSMYLGGKSYDYGHAIALDPSRNAYVVGRTDSSKFPATNAVPGGTYSGSRDTFVTKLLTASLVMSVQPALVVDEALFPVQVSHGVVVSWPASSPEFILECRQPSATEWLAVTQPVEVVDGRRQVTLPASAATCFFRLRLPGR